MAIIGEASKTGNDPKAPALGVFAVIPDFKRYDVPIL